MVISDLSDRRDGVLTAYLPADVVFCDGGPEALAAMVRQGRREDAVFGLGVEIGTGSIKLYGAAWRGAEREVTVNIKVATPAPEGDIAGLIAAVTAGLRRLTPGDLDPAAPGRLFSNFAAPEDFFYAYGTQGLRDKGRREPALPGVRVLNADEEGLVAFDSIVPPDMAGPGAVAVEIGSGSTEVVRVGADGVPRPLGFAIGGKSIGPPLDEMRRFLAGEPVDGDLVARLESPPEAVKAFFAGDAPARRIFVNPSKASAVFRAFAAPGGHGKLDADVVASYQATHPDDGFSTKSGILLAIVEGLGLDGFQEGRAGGLKAGMARVVARAWEARWG